MVDITFEEIVQAAQKLKPEQKAALVQSLQLDTPDEETSLTREQAIAELEVLRAAGAFDHVQSLYGKYANPNAPEISEEEFHAQMHAIATEWEQELDEFDTDED